MKTTLWFAALITLFAPPLHAGYERFQADKDNYTPPNAFIQKKEPAAEKMTQDTGTKDSSGIIERYKLKYLDGPNGDRDRPNDFGPDDFGIDKDRFREAAKMAADTDRVIGRVKKAARLGELQTFALLRHPKIAAAQKKVTAEIQSFDQVANLEDSLRQYAGFTKALNNNVGPLKAKDSIKLSFPTPGIFALKGRVVDAQVGILLEEKAIAQRQVVRDVTAAFWDLMYTEQSIGIINETIAAFQRLKDVAMVLYKSGRTSFQDLIKINIKLEELQEDLTTLRSKRSVVESRLLELTDLPPDAIIGRALQVAPVLAVPPVERLYAAARKHRQELQILRLKISKVSAMVEMAETMLEARSSLGLSLAETDFINTAGTDAPQSAFKEKTMAAMKNNHPVQAWYGVNEPWLAQTRQTLQGLKKELEARENATDRMVRGAWFNADKTRREFILYKERILDLAKSALDVTTKEYEAGAIPFSQAIDSYTYWLKVKLLIAEKRSRLGTAFADLENLTGTGIH